MPTSAEVDSSYTAVKTEISHKFFHETSYSADIASCHSQRLFYNHRCIPLPQNFPAHTHDNWEMIFLINGEVSYFMDGKSYPLFPDSLIVTRPGVSHAMEFNKMTDYERCNILFDEAFLSSQIQLQIPKEISVFHFKRKSMVSDLFTRMDFYCQNFEGSMLEVILLHLVEEVLYHIVLTLKSANQTSEYTMNSMVLHAVEYIENNIVRPLPLELLCEELHISRSYLHQLFIRNLKTSPGQYILTKKLLFAHNDLCAGRSPTDVAYSYGFLDYSTFYRAYKKHYGHAPSEETEHKSSFITQY